MGWGMVVARRGAGTEAQMQHVPTKTVEKIEAKTEAKAVAQAVAQAVAPDTLSLEVLPYLLRVARVARRRMIQNFAIAAVYNLIAIPLAFAGLATPLLAALAMSASSVTVSLNALRLPGADK
jgi:cation transport ATPase